jgi:retinol dehydrogenase 12
MNKIEERINMENKRNAVVTGATAGIGLATTIALACQGVTILGVGRKKERCDAAQKAVLDACPSARVEYLLCDLSSQTQIRRLAVEIKDRFDCLDILINDAGTVSSHFMTSEDGIEMQLAVNHLAPFLLTYELLPLIKSSPQGRIISVSSGSHYSAKLDFNDLQIRRRYSCLGQYKRVKLCNVLFTAELNRRLGAGSSVKAFAADPGLVNTEIGLKWTSGIEKFVWKLRMKSGADPSVPGEAIAWLATEPSISASEEIYWYNRNPKRPNPYALRQDAAKLLWEASERLCRIEAY